VVALVRGGCLAVGASRKQSGWRELRPVRPKGIVCMDAGSKINFAVAKDPVAILTVQSPLWHPGNSL
jgi:hypothetical protein